MSRIIKVFTAPAEAFADIVRRPGWLVPLVLVILTGLVFTSLYSRHVGWERFIRQTLETNERMQQMPAEQRQAALDMQRKIVPVMGYVGPIVFIPVSALIVAGVLTLVFKVIHDSPLKFRNVFCITSYSYLPSIVGTILGIAVMFMKDPDEFNLENPTAFNAGSYLPAEGAAKWLKSLAGSIDLFSLWTIFLLATGLKAAVPKLTFGQCLMGVAIPWLIVVVLKMGWASMFG